VWCGKLALGGFLEKNLPRFAASHQFFTRFHRHGRIAHAGKNTSRTWRRPGTINYFLLHLQAGGAGPAVLGKDGAKGVLIFCPLRTHLPDLRWSPAYKARPVERLNAFLVIRLDFGERDSLRRSIVCSLAAATA